jgi:Mn-dependent DtxR family transcriptional regulator
MIIRPPKKRQLFVLKFIYDFYKANQMYPIVAEIARHMTVSATAAQQMKTRLVKDGWLTLNKRGAINGLTDKTFEFVK